MMILMRMTAIIRTLVTSILVIANSNEIMMTLQKTCKKGRCWEGVLSCIGRDLTFIN